MINIVGVVKNWLPIMILKTIMYCKSLDTYSNPYVTIFNQFIKYNYFQNVMK